MRVKLTAAFIESVKPPERGQVDYWDARTPGLGLRVSQGGKKTWNLFYRNGERRMRRMMLGTYPILSLADARDQAAAELREVQLGNDPAEAKRDARDADTFADLATLYIERHAKPTKRTWARDEWLCNRELLPSWRNRKATEISRKDVIALLDRIVERGVPVLANRTKGLVSKMFNFALRRGIVEVNPAYGIGNPGGQERQRDRVLSEDEIRRIWTALDGESFKVAAIFRLALLTGQRKGEVCGLRWDELDLENGWWTIAAERSKNRLSHRVPLGPQAVAVFAALKPANGAGAPDVFPGGKRGLALTNLQKPTVRIKTASGVDFRFHDLRRTAASHMTGVGIPRLVVSKILNHVESGITAVYDRHSYDREKWMALTKWDERLREIITGEAASKVVNLDAYRSA
jgi:integrase